MDKSHPVIIFDWDDTLLDAERILSNAKISALAEILKDNQTYPFTSDWPMPGPSQLKQYTGHRFKEKIIPNIMNQFEPNNPEHAKWSEDVYQRFRRYYQKEIKLLFSGVKDMLVTLKKSGFIICIASNKSRDLLENEIEQTKVGSLLTYIIAGDDHSINKQFKPHPAMIDQIQEKFDKDTLFIMVGDRPFDIQAARASHFANNTRTIGIRTQKDLQLNADIEIDSAAEITLDLIESILLPHR